MPISLDTLLFWSGLALLSIGLFVFLTGKTASDESKRESNRFEAFGIKIDVNNPSLILIMLGVVMMLAPKFIPRENPQTPISEGGKAAQSDLADSMISAPPRLSDLMPDKPAPASPPPHEPPLPTPSDQPTPPASHQPPHAATGTATPAAQPATASTAARAPAPAPAPKKPTAPPAAQPAKPTPAAKSAQPVAQQPAAAPPPANLVIAVVADVSPRAGIDESAEAYAQRAAKEIEQGAGEIFSDGVRIDRDAVEDLRNHLAKGGEDYQGLCESWQADLLILGDLRIVTGWSSIDSAYWPDYHLHLYNCETRRARYEVFKHLNPSNRDGFPFQEAINEKTIQFLSESLWIIDSH